MSLKKPIIKVTTKCFLCNGKGYRDYMPITTTGKVKKDAIGERKNCQRCNGLGKIDVRQNDPQFKKYYIKNLEEVIDYLTKIYRHKRDEAQEYLKKMKEYCKELDKVVNKGK